MFYIPDKELYLIPTSECVLLNIMANKTININKPIKYTAFNMNFRKEAGAAGKDTRGLIRLHQFPKVEMVGFTKEEDSETLFNEFVINGENALSLLGLPYRIVNLCSGDLGFNSSKTYDLEVWMAGSNEYREVSSISNCKDFQSIGLNCKYYDEENNNEKKYLHALNGTCLGVGRILAAIMENYYDEKENIIHIPKALINYTKFNTIKIVK
jgi:seryl-tRNA synthetase